MGLVGLVRLVRLGASGARGFSFGEKEGMLEEIAISTTFHHWDQIFVRKSSWLT